MVLVAPQDRREGKMKLWKAQMTWRMVCQVPMEYLQHSHAKAMEHKKLKSVAGQRDQNVDPVEL